ANRCLYCYDAPCTHAYPTHIDVPSFIKKIASDNLTGSARVIFDANPIGASCARVCPVEALCEGACVEKTLVEKPIEIGRLQRYATDDAISKGKELFKAGEPNGKSIGIIGSGPAGLSCAAYLARLGYAVTVYEKKALAGGLDTYGMAEYKMSQKDSLAEVGMVEKLGVSFALNAEIVQGPKSNVQSSEQIGFDQLQNEHDAIFIGMGLGKSNDLNIEGEDKDGVYEALDFIETIKTRDWESVPIGKTVAVIGAGNTAIDAVTQAKRLGAEKVMLVYRKTEKDISAYDYEYELAKKDGVEFVWQASPIEISGNGKVEALRCRKTDGSEEVLEIPCDMVIKAIGQKKQKGFFEQLGIALDEKGRVKVNENMQTSERLIFAGGDCVNGGAEAVDASQAGKLAAIGIHFVLTGEETRFAGSTN
ncbi:MAG: NAD(P)-dependent oxidoreductase, partial [Acidobacteria bacterium]|nr:NAD(P)-dependent oxidoreductase [Acidobacteriota bacterium]